MKLNFQAEDQLLQKTHRYLNHYIRKAILFIQITSLSNSVLLHLQMVIQNAFQRTLTYISSKSTRKTILNKWTHH